MLQLTPEIEAAIKKYNTARRINEFLYKDEEASNMLNVDRGKFITMIHQIERELIDSIHQMFHGKKVTITGDKGLGRVKDGTIGTIIHEKTRQYHHCTHKDQPYEQQELKITSNNVSFRWIDNNDLSKGETIALWVDTGDRYSTHLYTINQLTLV